MNTRKLLIAVVAAGAALGHAWASAHGAHGEEEKVTPVQIQKLPDFPGKQVIMAVVDYKPGQASAPHSHSGSVLAYVLEGEIVSQLTGQEPVTYKAGEAWYEAPRAGHLVSRNASNVRPAKLLAFVLTDEGGTVKEPLPK
ncbi:MAG: cupin domain-containing protein [Variovorax sp.]|nr:MAG: cupin domain-containing protein [Variovorax sp.]